MSASLLFSTFFNNLFPILLISGAGFIIGKTLPIDPRSLGRVIFYIFSPILVFDLLINSQLNWNDALATVSFTIIIILTLSLLGFLTAVLFKLNRQQTLAVALVSGFGNNGNFGLPVVLFAFGNSALEYAMIYFVTTALLFNTFGVLIASLGQADLKTALLGIIKVPTVYAVLFAVTLNWLDIHLALPLKRTVDLASGGSIPLMLVLLGVELSRSNWSHNLRAIGVGSFMRLVAGPAMGLLIAGLLGLQGDARQSSVIQAAMPAAVNNSVIATEFNLEPQLVTAIVLVSTILSPLTLTPLIVLLAG